LTLAAPAELQERAQRVKLLVFDVDGVLTDGGLYYGPQGELMKRFDVHDGHGIVMARLAGLPSAVLTARKSEMVEVRGKELKLAAIFQGRKEKGPALEELAQSLGFSAAECAYMGDDTNDLPCFKRAGLAACPSDAMHEAKEAVHFVAGRAGGHGAARELVELVLRAQGKWDDAVRLMGP
jgi:3-deoxy-D-manno-octulosonate 8-phosphate phosphatase (KDO 8-P phosphatase)